MWRLSGLRAPTKIHNLFIRSLEKIHESVVGCLQPSMSVLGKIWQVKNTDSKTSLLQKLLKNRGLHDDNEVEQFFHPRADRDFHDPFLMKDMERAVVRIGEAIEKSQRIMIFGDYDVDGITGCAILMRALRLLKANVSYRLPHRIEDGYGLREKFIREFKKLGVALAITVDNGISCYAEVQLANELGIDVIISDHHTVPEKIPAAFAILHPKLPGCGYPFSELTGAGVALKLAQALFQRQLKNPEEETQKLLDLACMGTIADVGELRGENRYIVKEGLKVLENTRWPGLSRLKEYAGVKGKIDTHTIGFLLGPRINAAGRISHPSHALRLLLHDAEHTAVLADILEKLNRKRQKLMEELLEIAETLAAPKAEDPIIIIHHPEFHGGIIGLLAAKLSEKYGRPAIVMEERNGTLVGSCRSPTGINIVEALTESKELLTHFGGHAAAAGFDVPKEHLPLFEEKLKNFVGSRAKPEQFQAALSVDCELPHEDISGKTLEILEWFEPFGVGNEKPRFLCTNVPIHRYETVGAVENGNRKHLKIQTAVNEVKISCIGFRLGKFASLLEKKDSITIVCEVERDSWRGNGAIQLKIVDFKLEN